LPRGSIRLSDAAPREFVRGARALRNHELVIVAGKAGIGKTRLALEIFDRFVQKNPSYKSYCIFNREGVSLFHDLKDYFNADGDYLIFVDDANHVTDGKASYLVELCLKLKGANRTGKD